MQSKSSRPGIWRSLGYYLLVAASSIAVLIPALHLRAADLRVPFQYESDVLWTLVAIKGMILHGWFLFDPNCGLPGGMEIYEYPGSDLLHWGLLKIISLWAHSPVLTMNLFYLLTYPLTALVAVFVFRRLGISALTAFVLGLLYTFLPYHIYRNLGHLFLAAYFMVPCGMLLVCWLLQGKLDFWSARPGASRPRAADTGAMIVMAVLVAASGAYYGFFTCVLLAVAALLQAVRRRQVRPLLNAGVPMLIMLLVVGASIAPMFWYQHKYGKNPAAVVRGRNGESYGMKISQWLIPVTNHRIHALAALKDVYNQKAPLVNENTTSTLGIVGSLGFLFLIAYALFSGRASPVFTELSILNLSATLFATIGGFGAVLTLIGFIWIRSYNRISVFISFMSLLAVGLLIEQGRARWAQRSWAPVLVPVLLIALLVVGLLDEIPRIDAAGYAATKVNFLRDRDFVTRSEAALPAKAMVFQLPYIPFPENPKPTVHIDYPYDHFRGYIHSQQLRWSFGAMHGRAGDQWQQWASSLPTSRMLQEVARKGFDGLYINRAGYEDGGKQLEREITAILGTKPIESADQQLAMYRLRQKTR